MRLFIASRKQRYNTAVAIYLAAYTYRLPELTERSRVDEQGYLDMKGSLFGFSPIELQRMWSQVMKSAWRAYALSDRGIPPALKGEIWRLPKSRRMLWGFKTGPSKLMSDYLILRPSHGAGESRFGIQRIGCGKSGSIRLISQRYSVPQNRRW
jgi:hypothetical protein